MAKLRQKDIAREVGVSPTSVSLVLNDPETPRVSEQTKSRIFEYVRAHAPDFASPAATRDILFVCDSERINPEIHDFYYGPVFRTAEETARSFGRRVLQQNYRSEAELLEMARDPQVAGIIHVNYINHELLARIQKTIPVVAVNSIYRLDCDVIKIDLRHGARDQVHYLCGRGHRRIAFVGLPGPPHESGRGEALHERFGGYAEGLFVENIPINKDYVHQSALPSGTLYVRDSICRALIERLFALPEPPTAILAFNDFIALSLMRTARHMGMKLPEDLSVVGCDDIDACSLIYPRLTTLRQDREAMGTVAVEVLEERLERGRWDNPREVLCSTEFVERESVADVGAPAPAERQGAA